MISHNMALIHFNDCGVFLLAKHYSRYTTFKSRCFRSYPCILTDPAVLFRSYCTVYLHLESQYLYFYFHVEFVYLKWWCFRRLDLEID